jgi:integrase
MGEQQHDDLIDDYCLELLAAGRSPRTIATRRRQVRMICRTVDPHTATRADLVRWLAHPAWKPATRNSNRAAARSFFGWLVEAGQRADDPSVRLPKVTVPPPVPHPAPERALADARTHAHGPYEQAMVELAARAGLRRREIATLRFSDLLADVDGQAILRVLGKGGRVRVLPIPEDVAAAVRALRSPWVFPGRWAGQHVSEDQVGHTLSRLLGPGWSGHSLRHRYASRAYAASHDLLAVQQLLEHASPATTMGYVATNMDDLRAAAGAAS